MPIPSWEELRQLAEQVSESKKPSEISTGELAAKGFSDFVSKLLTAGTPTQHYTGALTKEGELTPINAYRGGSLAERIGRFAGGRGSETGLSPGMGIKGKFPL